MWAKSYVFFIQFICHSYVRLDPWHGWNHLKRWHWTLYIPFPLVRSMLCCMRELKATSILCIFCRRLMAGTLILPERDLLPLNICITRLEAGKSKTEFIKILKKKKKKKPSCLEHIQNLNGINLWQFSMQCTYTLRYKARTTKSSHQELNREMKLTYVSRMPSLRSVARQVTA